MPLPSHILNNLEQDHELFVEIEPSNEDARAWVSVHKFEAGGYFEKKYPNKRFVLRRIEYSKSLVNKAKQYQEDLDYEMAALYEEKFATDTNELEAILVGWNVDLAMLVPPWESDHPF